MEDRRATVAKPSIQRAVGSEIVALRLSQFDPLDVVAFRTIAKVGDAGQRDDGMAIPIPGEPVQ
jgi:hypothetical protein